MKPILCFMMLLQISLFISCNSQKKIKDDAEITSININNKVVPKLSNLVADDFKLISLENNSRCNIGMVNKVELINNEIFVLDAFISNELFVFNKKGEFLRKIAQKGRGPGEYLQLYSFCVDKINNYIYLLDNGLNKILQYSLDKFSFIKEYHLEFNAFSFQITNDGSFVFYCNQNKINKYCYNIIVTSKDFRIKNKIFKQNSNKQYPIGMLSTNRGYQYNNLYIFSPLFSDTYYSLSSKFELNKYMKFDFGENSLPPDDFFDNSNNFNRKLSRSKYINCVSALETDKHVFVKYLMERKEYIGIFSKEQNKLIASCAGDEYIDDLGLLSYSYPDFIGEGKFISIISPLSIIQNINNNNNVLLNPKIKIIASNIQESDNPILMLYSIN